DGTSKIKQKIAPKSGSKNGRSPHFAYYPNSSHDGVGKEMTVTHKAYQEAISTLKIFCIETLDGEVIILEVEEAKLEYYINDEGQYYLVDILIVLKSTYPFYYFYKWEGILAIEIWVSHKTEQKKIEALNRKGIPTIECKISKKLLLNEDIQSDKEYLKNVQKVINRYSDIKFHLYGRFISDAKIDETSVWGEKYLEFKNYHNEKKRMELHFRKLEKQKLELEKKNKELISENYNLDLEIKNKHTVIEKLSKNKMEVEANKELLKICKIENENLIKKVSALNFELVKMKEYKDHPIKTFWKDKIRFK
ncbi:hypothetical protein I1C64_003014, partial [Listeria monocytogenes]|nr:hypothetical protein [Listeria monocytogenes]